MQTHWTKTKTVIGRGEKLLSQSNLDFLLPVQKSDVERRLLELNSRWQHLRQISAELTEKVKQAWALGQFFQDANEVESWIREKTPLVTSRDFGKDERSAEVSSFIDIIFWTFLELFVFIELFIFIKEWNVFLIELYYNL